MATKLTSQQQNPAPMLPNLRIVYRCRFCRDQLKPMPYRLADAVFFVLGLRPHYCPHCFEISLRPAGWLRIVWWPFLLLWRLVGKMLGD